MDATSTQPLHECEVCLETDCRFLLYPCQHFACSACVGRMAQEYSAARDTFLCQSCRQEVNLPLPDHRLVNNQNEEYRVSGTLSTQHFLLSRNNPAADVIEETEPVKTAEDYHKMVQDDKWQDKSCPSTCLQFGDHFKTQIHQALDGMSKTCIKTEGDRHTYSWKGVCKAPFRILLLLTIIRQCVGIFANDENLDEESLKDASIVRETATTLLSSSTATFKHKFPLWKITFSTMIIYLSIGLIFNGIGISQGMHMPLTAVVCAFNTALLVFWIMGCVYTYARKKPINMFMDLAIHLSSEFSVYPQLCMFAIDLRDGKIPSIVLFALSSVTLLCVWILRLCLLIYHRKKFRMVFKRLICNSLGNYFVVLSLLVALVMVSGYYEKQMRNVFQITIFISILATTLYNNSMFHISHLCEFTQMSALYLISNHECSAESKLKGKKVLDNICENLHSFHKVFYTFTSPWLEIVVSVFPLPIIIMFASAPDVNGLVLTAVYCTLNIFVNHKVALIAMAVYLKVLAILIYFILVVSVAIFIVFIYVILFILISPMLLVFLLTRLCCKNNNSVGHSEESITVDESRQHTDYNVDMQMENNTIEEH